ncbi:MAG: cation transporter [Candidatus Methylomirabilales bacterium]
MSDSGCELEEADALERRTLWTLLIINASMFVVEAVAGWLGESTGLLADSLDMLADATVYGIGLYAVGRSLIAKARAAFASGVSQIVLGIGVLVDVARRFLVGSEPISAVMIVVGTVALIANVTSLLLIAKHRQGGVHMRASWIFSKNDVIANLGVILSGALVVVLGSRFPDLVIGAAIATIVIRGGLEILREANEVKEKAIGA